MLKCIWETGLYIASLLDLTRNVVIKDMTILAPQDSPNTDGIDPGTYLRDERGRSHPATSWLYKIL